MDDLPELNADSLNDALHQHPLVLIDFWAPSCASCLAMLPLLQSLQQRLRQVHIVKVNVDEQGELAETYQVRSLPTLILLKDRPVVGRLQGVCGESQIMTLLQPWLEENIDTHLQALEQKRSAGAGLLPGDLHFLQYTLEARPENSRVRALLIHALLDQLKTDVPQPREALSDIHALLQVKQFEWLRGPQIQQAQQRLGFIAGIYGDEFDSEIYALLLQENYQSAAEKLLQRLEQGDLQSQEKIKRQFLQLIDTLTDRVVAQQLRRRFFRWLNSQNYSEAP